MATTTRKRKTITLPTHAGNKPAFTQANLDTLCAGPIHAVEIVRLAAELWGTWPEPPRSELVKSIYDVARRILFHFRASRPDLARVGLYTTQETRRVAATSYREWHENPFGRRESFTKDRDALANPADDIKCGLMRKEIAALILMAIDNSNGKVTANGQSMEAPTAPTGAPPKKKRRRNKRKTELYKKVKEWGATPGMGVKEIVKKVRDELKATISIKTVYAILNGTRGR